MKNSRSFAGPLLFSLALFFVVSLSAHAQVATPSVTSVSVSPSSGASLVLRSLSYTSSGSSGSSVLFTCQAGVTIRSDTGGTFTCGTRASLSSADSDSIGISAINITGTTQTVFARVYPKDRDGNDYDAGSLSTTFSVAKVANPISDFSVSATTLNSGGSLTVTWGSSYLPNVNLRFDCSNLTIVPSGSSIPIPCGQIAFASSLAANGSQTVTVTNPSDTPATLTVVGLPVITSGQYNGLDAPSASVTVLGKVAAQDPSASSFAASSQVVASSATTTFTFSAFNAKGANVRISCADDIAVYGAAGNKLPCEGPALAASTIASSSAFRFVNSGTHPRVVRVSLLLERRDGVYLVAPSRDILLTVLAPGAVPAAQSALSTNAVAVSSAPSVSSIGGKAHSPITVGLSKGMRHAQVTILQTFLAQDTAVYPEGSISGYFGPATEAAVKRFQKRHGIAKEGSVGYGTVGPATRAKINALLKP